MAIAAWKRFEKSPQWQRKKRLSKRLVGKEFSLRPDVRVLVIEEGGWWFSLSDRQRAMSCAQSLRRVFAIDCVRIV